MHWQIEACRVCGSKDLYQVLDLGDQALTGIFPKDEQTIVESGPLRLVKCTGPDACGLVQLEHTYSPEQMYGTAYGYRSGLNQSMVRHLQERVQGVLSRATPPDGSVILDIGSNDGTTLSAYPSDRFLLLGIDPTAAAFREHYPPNVQVVADFFSEDVFRSVVGDRQAFVVTSFSMLYDLDRPLQFMHEVRNILAPGGIWVFEQSYLPLMLERNAYDTVCHEHIEYYSLSQIAWMANAVGFTLIDVELNDVNGGSFCVTAMKSDEGMAQSPLVDGLLRNESEIGIDDPELYNAFARRVAGSRESLRSFVAEAKAARRMIGALGASTKGNVLLQYCGFTRDDLTAIGEVNEDKFGAFTPGTHIPIVPEDELISRGPDYLIVLPWHFRETFLSKPLGEGTSLVFPLPELEVVSPSGLDPGQSNR